MPVQEKVKHIKQRHRLEPAALCLPVNPWVDKGRLPLMFNPALTTCASERMKTQRFSYFTGFAARERMREAKPVKLKKVAFSHFFDTLKRRRLTPAALFNMLYFFLNRQ